MMNITQKQKEIIENNVDTLLEKIDELCGIEPHAKLYEIKKEIWTKTCTSIKSELKDNALLLFIGPYSSGKSSFINAILNRDILPTNSGPCTAAITEIKFKENGEDSAVLYRKDGKTETVSFDEALRIINGPTGAAGDIAQYNHIELYLDTEKLKKNGGIDLKLFVDKICFVDCPGYGSPFYSNEEVIQKYIERAGFIFWMTPIDKYGGISAKRYLGNIKKKTSALLPVITKSDKEQDEEEREKIKNQYFEELGDLFKTEEPIFISSKLYKDAMSVSKKIEAINENMEKSNQAPDESMKNKIKNAEKEYEKYRRESGFDNLRPRIFDKVEDKVIDESKIKSTVYRLKEVLKEVEKAANTEKEYWIKELEKIGYTESDGDKYAELSRIKKAGTEWIEEKVDASAASFADRLYKDIMSLYNRSKEGADNAAINTIFRDTFDNITKDLKRDCEVYFSKTYKKYIEVIGCSLEIKEKNVITELGFDSFDELKEKFFAVLESMRYAGAQSIVTGATGSALLASSPALTQVAAVGSFLGPIAMVAGIGFLAVALVPLIPVIFDNVKRRQEKSKDESGRKIKDYITNHAEEEIKRSLRDDLNKFNNTIYEDAINRLEGDSKTLVKNREKCKEVNEKLDSIQEGLKTNFGGYYA